jgi:hypothetical protein
MWLAKSFKNSFALHITSFPGNIVNDTGFLSFAWTTIWNLLQLEVEEFTHVCMISYPFSSCPLLTITARRGRRHIVTWSRLTLPGLDWLFVRNNYSLSSTIWSRCIGIRTFFHYVSVWSEQLSIIIFQLPVLAVISQLGDELVLGWN